MHLPISQFMKRNLTIGMVVYDDWDGFYFSIQAIRMYHREIINRVEFVVINSNPSSDQGKAVESFCKSGKIKEPLHYYNDDNLMGTATRSKIFSYAQTPYVLVIDSHVMIEAGGIKSLIDFFEAGKDNGNLIQAPLLYDHLEDGPSYFKPEWRSGMFGTWQMDERSKGDEPFEIPSQGLGLFSCRKDAWLGFAKGHTGFGSEEGYIQEKFLQNGKKTICLPWLKWLHRFSRPSGVPYPNRRKDRVKNYVRGHLELDKPVFEILQHFKSIGTKESDLNQWISEVVLEKCNY